MSEEKIFKINLSVKFKKEGSARRFIIRADDFDGLYRAFSAEMNNAAPSSSVYWIDGDGDKVLITSVAEFEEAYVQFAHPNNNLLVVTTEENASAATAPQQQQPMGEQSGVRHNACCDLCDRTIYGTRFKCLICNDYDLCYQCEAIGAHADHAMMRIVDPKTTYVPWGARINHTFNGIIDATRNTMNGNPAVGQQNQFDDLRSKGVQIMNEVGTLITNTLSNFGIEADYDVYDGRRRATTTNPPASSSQEEKEEPKTENKKEETKKKTPKNAKSETMKGVIAGLQKLSKAPEGLNGFSNTTEGAAAENETANIMKKYENTFKKVDAAGARVNALQKFDDSLEALAALEREKAIQEDKKAKAANVPKTGGFGAPAQRGIFSAKHRKNETETANKFSSGGFHTVKDTMPVGKGLFSRHKAEGQKARPHHSGRFGYHSDESVERSPSPPRLGSSFEKARMFGQKPTTTYGSSSTGFGNAKNAGCYRSESAKSSSFAPKTSGFGGFCKGGFQKTGGFGAPRSSQFGNRLFEGNSEFGGNSGFGGGSFGSSQPTFGGFQPRGGFGTSSGFGNTSGFGSTSGFGGGSGFGSFGRGGFVGRSGQVGFIDKSDPYADIWDEDYADHVYEPEKDINDESVFAPKRIAKEKKQSKKAEKAAAKATAKAMTETDVKAVEVVEAVEKEDNTVTAKTSLAVTTCEVALEQKNDTVIEVEKPNPVEEVAANVDLLPTETTIAVVPLVKKEEVYSAALPVKTKTDEDAQSIGSEVEHLEDVDSDGWVDANSTIPSAPEVEVVDEPRTEVIETVISSAPSTSQQNVYPQLTRDDVMAGSQARQETYANLLLMGFLENDSRRAIAHCGADLWKCVAFITGTD